MKKRVCFLLYAILFSVYGIAQNNDVVRWPNFIRDWATDYKLDSGTRLDLINIIDSVYQFLEDSTALMDNHCGTICRMKDGIHEAIVHDEELEFRCMMRATAHNFWGYSLKDRRFFECGCSGDVFGDVVSWHTLTTDSADFMSFVLIPVSWEAPAYYAELCIFKFDDMVYAMAGLNVFNNENNVLNKIQVQFLDSTNNIINEFNEDELYVNSTSIDSGVKILFLPFEEVITALLQSQQMIVNYQDAYNETKTIWGVPHAAFLEQIEDCPRLMMALKNKR